MFVGYLMLLAGVFAFLPLAVKASGTCTPPDHVINAVTQKAENGSALCATSPPTETLAANFKILCLGACMKRPSCEHAFSTTAQKLNFVNCIDINLPAFMSNRTAAISWQDAVHTAIFCTTVIDVS